MKGRVASYDDEKNDYDYDYNAMELKQKNANCLRSQFVNVSKSNSLV